MSKQPGRMWEDADVAKLLSELMDADKIQLICSQFPDGRHHTPYVAKGAPPPPRGCVNCWKAYWWHVAATTPPHLRAERLEQAYRAVYDANKLFERGEWDLELADHAEVTIEKDAWPDQNPVESKSN